MVLAGGLGLAITIVVWVWLIPEPGMVGIYVEEMSEKEAILHTVSLDKEVFKEVIRTTSMGGG